jgi:ADP-heptose:LPS heptosyltransferase/Tfp pilus assembly protein PilF
MSKKDQIRDLNKLIQKNNKKNRVADNIENYKKIINLNPENINKYLNELGHVYENSNQLLNAIDCYEQILKTEKQNISTIGVLTNQIGICYYNVQDFSNAIKYFNKVLLIKELSDVYCNIGQCNIEQKKYKEAELNLLKSFNIDRNHKSCSSLGRIYYFMKQYDKSIQYYKISSSIDDQLLYNLSFSYLSKKDFKTGFKLYEKRLNFNNINSQTGLKDRLDITLPYWNGIDNCNNLLILSEQGLGDNIQYHRFIIELSEKYPEIKITYLCKKELADIFKEYPNINIVKELLFGAFNFDYKLYIMSLPKILGLTNILPNQINYIKTNETKLIEWQNKLQPFKFKVGFVYNGLLSSFIDKTIPLKEFEELLNLDISFICLHRKKEIENDLSDISFAHKIIHYDIDNVMPFEDTICILQNIDLLITIDTFIAHLAGVLNVKTWLLLGTSEWRWSNDPDKTYWYDSVELIRTTGEQCLSDLLPHIKEKLQKQIRVSEFMYP